MSLLPPADPNLCPLCGQSNRCAMEVQRATGLPQGPCWCTTASFTPALLQRIPEAARGNACVCAQCAQAGAAQVNSQPMKTEAT